MKTEYIAQTQFSTNDCGKKTAMERRYMMNFSYVWTFISMRALPVERFAYYIEGNFFYKSC